MNQKIIWLITGLLTVAVIGVMSLQLKFILDSREEKENLFDNHIRNALKNVAKRIEDADYLMELGQFANGYSRGEEIFKALEAKQIRSAISIDERINLPTLDKLLKMEFQERGINIYYNYGIFSNSSNSFIAYNNHYVIPEENPIEVLTPDRPNEPLDERM